MTQRDEYTLKVWRYYSLTDVACRSLDEAISMASAIRDTGEGVPDCVLDATGKKNSDKHRTLAIDKCNRGHGVTA